MKTRTSESYPLEIAELAVGGGVVGVTLCPGKRGPALGGYRWERDLPSDVEAIRRWGACAVATLIEEHEFEMLEVPGLGDAMTAAGIEWHHLPIVDVSTPDARFEWRWQYAGSRLRERLRAGERLLVHCRGGLGRAGSVAARLLVEFGERPAVAIERVRRVRPGAIETEAQEGWVRAQRAVEAGAERRRSRELGCLLGGAIGDAFGYRVEFDSLATIRGRHGPQGLRLAAAEGTLVVSDDTQMTLFTLEGMVRAPGVQQISEEVREAYLDWFGTQTGAGASRTVRGRLAAQLVMRQVQAPGSTCLSALRQGGRGTVERPINNSKGCGGVMRTAPLGFLAETVNDAALLRLGAEVAALTHGHPDGYLPAGAIAVLVRDALAGVPWAESLSKVLALLRERCASERTVAAIEDAVKAAADGVASCERVSELGEGWVGEEALAIGLYAALVAKSFHECIELATNHDGDSDSTASIAGQLYGARHGLGCLPAEAVYRLDVLEPLLELAGEWGRVRQTERP